MNLVVLNFRQVQTVAKQQYCLSFNNNIYLHDFTSYAWMCSIFSKPKVTKISFYHYEGNAFLLFFLVTYTQAKRKTNNKILA